MSGFAAAVAVAAVRERRTSHLEGPRLADANRIEHLVAIVFWAIAVFVLVYARLAGIRGEFAGLATRLDAFHFAFTTLATVGFGDVHASGQAARLVVTIQIGSIWLCWHSPRRCLSPLCAVTPAILENGGREG
jgi:voltage-gated potassium channel